MTMIQSFHSSIGAEITRYIEMKQALGRSFKTASFLLLKLDQFLCKLGKPSPDLTAETFRLYCDTMESASTNAKSTSMRVVRNFCIYRRRLTPACFVPDPTQFPRVHALVKPYIFTELEIGRLLNLSSRIPNSVRCPLRGTSTHLAIVLLYTTGLRRGELLRLTAKDYDPSTHLLLVRASKFNKSRILPLPGDVSLEIEQSLNVHSSVHFRPNVPLITSAYRGYHAYSPSRLTRNVQILLKLAAIEKPNGNLPRIHDFRFSFAVNALLRWYRDGVDVQAKLPLLSAYMGHVSVLSTYYYLRFIEPLAAHASDLFANRYGALIHPQERRLDDEG